MKLVPSYMLVCVTYGQHPRNWANFQTNVYSKWRVVTIEELTDILSSRITEVRIGKGSLNNAFFIICGSYDSRIQVIIELLLG